MGIEDADWEAEELTSQVQELAELVDNLTADDLALIHTIQELQKLKVVFGRLTNNLGQAISQKAGC